MLSILERELRIASRRRWTFWSRVITTVMGFGIGLCLVVMSTFSRVATGEFIFTVLAFVSFWFCLIQGVRRAASSISDEKRDGTLGLLFLTDLSTIDIIAGKVFAVAIPLAQPLLAFVPALAISVLLGGATGGEVFRAAITFASILLYSISAGLFVSSLSRGEETGQSTIFLLLANLAIPRMFGRGPLFALRYFSPWSAYANIPDPGYRVSANEFWYSLLFTNVLSFTLLTGAGFFLKRRWEDRTVAEKRPLRRAPPNHPVEIRKRAAILDRNPGEWLATRHSMGNVSKWLFIALTAVLCLLAAAISNAFGGSGGTGKIGGVIILALAALLLLIRLASQASYPLAEARRSGAIEMMLSTPLDPKCLLTGQLVALRNQFVPAFGMIFIASVFIISYEQGALELAGSAVMVAIFWGLLALITATVAAFGMWMGLIEKSPNAAFFKTILFTLLPLILTPCMWFVLPVGYIILFLVSLAYLTGHNYRRLLRNEKKYAELTPVGRPAPILAAPPVIKT